MPIGSTSKYIVFYREQDGSERMLHTDYRGEARQWAKEYNGHILRRNWRGKYVYYG